MNYPPDHPRWGTSATGHRPGVKPGTAADAATRYAMPLPIGHVPDPAVLAAIRAKALRVIPGLERLYGPQPWTDHTALCEDPYDTPEHGGKNEGFVFNGAFDGVVEMQVAEQLYGLVKGLGEARIVTGHRRIALACAETGTSDGLSAAFIARALEDVGAGQRGDGGEGEPGRAAGHLWTCELSDKRSTNEPRPWPGFWDALNLRHRITYVLGDSRDAGTWARAVPPLPEGEDALDFIFIDSEHSYATVMAEWNVLGTRLAPGGIATFHDTRLFPEVARAVGEIAAGLRAREGEDAVSVVEGWSCRGFTILYRRGRYLGPGAVSRS